MKRVLVLLALAASFAAGSALRGTAAPGPRGLPTSAGWPAGQVQVFDSWYGTVFQRDYSKCDAVATVTVHGNYNYGFNPDGSIYVAVGLTWPGDGVGVTVDGNGRRCFG